MKRAVSLSLLMTLIVLIVSVTYSLKAKATDLGVYGETAPIKEDDLQEHIINKRKSLDQEELRGYQESIHQLLGNSRESEEY